MKSIEDHSTKITLDNCSQPIIGMTKRIAYADPLMAGAFVACCSATLNEPGAIEEFIKSTGITLPIPRRGIEAMVDKACGYDPYAVFFAKWADWVAENIWGLEGSEGTEPEDAV